MNSMNVNVNLINDEINIQDNNTQKSEGYSATDQKNTSPEHSLDSPDKPIRLSTQIDKSAQ